MEKGTEKTINWEFSKMMKDTNLQIQEGYKFVRRLKKNKSTLTRKLQNIKDKSS
jgi:hypothetical protein